MNNSQITVENKRPLGLTNNQYLCWLEQHSGARETALRAWILSQKRHNFSLFRRQLRCLLALWPNLNPLPVLQYYQRYTEGYNARYQGSPLPLLVIPRWEKFATTYNEAVQIVIHKIQGFNPGPSCWGGEQFDVACISETSDKKACLKALSEQQSGSDCIMIPAMFNHMSSGYSVWLARNLVQDFQRQEQKSSAHPLVDGKFFALGLLEVAVSYLATLLPDLSEDVGSDDTGWAHCLGDEYFSAGRKTSPIFDLKTKALFTAFESEQEPEEYSGRYGGVDHVPIGCVPNFL